MSTLKILVVCTLLRGLPVDICKRTEARVLNHPIDEYFRKETQERAR